MAKIRYNITSNRSSSFILSYLIPIKNDLSIYNYLFYDIIKVIRYNNLNLANWIIENDREIETSISHEINKIGNWSNKVNLFKSKDLLKSFNNKGN